MHRQSITVLRDAPVVYVNKDHVVIHVVDQTSDVEIQTVEQLGTYDIPTPIRKQQGLSQYLKTPAVSLVTEQGGRGPIFNEGQLITAGVLLGLLTDAVDEGELTPTLRARLTAFTDDIGSLFQRVDAVDANLADNTDLVDLINTQLETVVLKTHDPQEGFVTHDQTIVLDFTWPTMAPMIELSPCYGIISKQSEDTTDPDIHYVEIPDQELVYGHTGLVPTGVLAGQYQFTVKAAICAYVAPTIKNLLWTSANILASELLGLTENSAASPLEGTMVPNMGFRAQGYLILRNSGGTKVSGTAYVQMKIDAGSWVNIGRFRKLFQANETTPLTKHFDILTAADQSAHNYQFRVSLVVDAGGDTNRELTASIHVSTVAESGAGTVLTNNIQLKWAAKE